MADEIKSMNDVLDDVNKINNSINFGISLDSYIVMINLGADKDSYITTNIYFHENVSKNIDMTKLSIYTDSMVSSNEENSLITLKIFPYLLSNFCNCDTIEIQSFFDELTMDNIDNFSFDDLSLNKNINISSSSMEEVINNNKKMFLVYIPNNHVAVINPKIVVNKNYNDQDGFYSIQFFLPCKGYIFISKLI